MSCVIDGFRSVSCHFNANYFVNVHSDYTQLVEAWLLPNNFAILASLEGSDRVADLITNRPFVPPSNPCPRILFT